MGARYIERFDAAMPAEEVFRRMRIECIGRYIRCVTQQAEIILADEQVKDAGHATNTAVAFRCVNICWRVHLKSDFAAMASTFMYGHCYSPLFFAKPTAGYSLASRSIFADAFRQIRQCDRSSPAREFPFRGPVHAKTNRSPRCSGC